MTRLPDPMERLVADALDSIGEPYQVNVLALDFYLPDRDVFTEVKRMHSDRIAEQMSRADNVIAAQGVAAVKLLADMLRGLRPVTDKEQNE